jgi:hypothetical protein
VSDRFDELVGDVGDGEERERLRRVHELLLSVEPPPGVVAAPAPAPLRQRHRPQRFALLAAALAALAFGAGYFLGGAGGDTDAVRLIPMRGVGAASAASASIEILPEDKAGNWPMNVVLRGLEPSRDRSDWYELWLTRDGRLEDSCGRFMLQAGRNEVTLSVPYALRTYDGWVVTRHGSAKPLLTT